MSGVCSIWQQSEMEHEPHCWFCKKSLISGKRISNKPFVLIVQFLIQQASALERTWNAKGTDTIMTSPEREPPKTSTKKSAALRSPKGITPLGIHPVFIAIELKGGGRPTRSLLHAKMLLVPIRFFLYWVDYDLEGSTFSLSKCDFSRLFHTERSWHTSIYCGFCFWSTGFALWCKSIFFFCGWIRVLLFSKVPSRSE